MNPRARSLLVAAAPALLAAGLARARDILVVSPLAVPPAEGAAEAPAPPPEPGTDAWLAEMVRQTMISHRSAVAADAEITAARGVVLLRGQVVSEEYRALATAYAWDVPGVKGVDNRMEVVGTRASVRGAQLDRMNDAAITLRVKAALFRARGGLRTRVSTRDGVVILRGRARSAAERRKIESLAARLDGVGGVEDRMTTGR